MSKSQSLKVREQKVRVKDATYSYWVIDCGVIDGKRTWVRRDDSGSRFRSKQAAERWAARLRIDRKRIGNDALKLSDIHKKDAVSALALLDGRTTLTMAAEFYARHTGPGGGKKKLTELLDSFIQEKRNDNLREASIADASLKAGRFVDAFPNALAYDLTREDIDGWLQSMDFTPATRKSYLRTLRNLFNFAVRNDYRVDDPTKGIRMPKLDKVNIRVLRVDELHKLLATAKEYELDTKRSMVPYIALCALAGLRPEETQRCQWSDVHLRQKYVGITSQGSKTRVDRDVDMQDNLIAWLAPYQQQSGTIYFQRGQFDKIRRKAGLFGKDSWQKDVMRHSFASYHYREFRNMNDTCAQMGDNETTVRRHYISRVSKEQAKAFWKIRPTGSKIIQFEAKAAS